MNCEKCREQLPDYIRGDITGEMHKEMESHLGICPSCAEETRQMIEMWSLLDTIPQIEPSPGSVRRFSAILSACADNIDATPNNEFLKTVNIPKYHLRPVIQFAAAVVILTLGIWSGCLYESRKHMQQEVAALHSEIAGMKKMLSVSLLSQDSASQRLQGVIMSSDVAEPDDVLIRALVKTMNTDPNINIRLASIDALERYTDRQWVKKELVESLKQQHSPLVQVSLINLVVELDEKEAITVLESLIEDDDSLEPVKKRARTGLDKLI